MRGVKHARPKRRAAAINGQREFSFRATEGEPGPEVVALVRAAPSEREAALCRERERVLTVVRKKKLELERLEARMRTVQARVDAAVRPILVEQTEVENAIHEGFVELLEPGRLSKSRQAKVRAIYETLWSDGVIGPPRTPSFSCAEDPHADGEGDAWAGAGGFDGDGCGSDPHQRVGGGYSASRPVDGALDLSLRVLFKRLVVAFHPDRARGEGERARRTEMMKELTLAYESGDLAGLIELERTWELEREGTETLGASIKTLRHLERTIRDLEDQRLEILRELREVRRTGLYAMTRDFERAERVGEDPVSCLLAEGQQHLERLESLRDFVAGFRAGRLSWKAFLEGPPIADQPDDFVELTVDDILAAVMATVESSRPKPRKKHGKRKSRTASL
jgi:hypothetical protein